MEQSAHVTAVVAGVEDNLNSLMDEAKERIAKGKLWAGNLDSSELGEY